MQQIKDALSQDMEDFLGEQKWEQQIKESISDLLEYKPEKPLIHLYEKYSIKQRLEPQNKLILLINDIASLGLKIDPLQINFTSFSNKLLNIVIEKYQMNKLKKIDIMKCVFIILNEINNYKEVKDFFIKKALNFYEDLLNVNTQCDILYKSIIYTKCIQELLQILELSETKSIIISPQNIINFIESINEENQSLNRKYNTQTLFERYFHLDIKINIIQYSNYLSDHILNIILQ
ncbi:hypothetical protein IMG5_073110 [Ichthyophthirius multifiliis]|uniref:Uncharacterized protein n=1 Tax=Ichthyophthirius multifiliis TaxID=5932 RepID=G0QPY9_ICHMU|nr:hypothetical protein IMG5_073110 [Ichthyophthirius multifiliis]EGR32716.1 hypothetical protein IMG5_073110 [Ichthyophthirius multifiliis]|eukprot:XP_004036702.1 hypothetical protein IMG5_073110 [Ichthyophthirius multifiliis]